MRAFRIGLATIIMVALALGYARSQMAAFAGEAPAYAATIDTPVVKALALVALILVVVFAFVPDREAGSE